MSILFLLFFFTAIMPEAKDCTFDILVENYTEIVLDRMDSKDLEQYVWDSLMDYFAVSYTHLTLPTIVSV